MRELMTVPADKLHKSAALSLDQLALVEPLAIGAHAVARAEVEAGEYALVIGAGPIGLSVIQFAQLAGARVLVVDVNEERLDFARAHFSPEAAIRAGDGAVAQIKRITGGDLPTAVFDATGHPALSVPCGMSNGLPVGMMLVGRHFDDATVLRAGHAYQVATGLRTAHAREVATA